VQNGNILHLQTVYFLPREITIFCTLKEYIFLLWEIAIICVKTPDVFEIHKIRGSPIVSILLFLLLWSFYTI
jgi:hypothetical protein